MLCLLLRGCGEAETITETVTIEKPVPKIEYVDRWRTDTVRFVRTVLKERTDTIHDTSIVSRLDTLLIVDTVKIVEAWLAEVAKYDTTIDLESASIRLRWQNYQNFSEQLKVDYTPKKIPLSWAFGIHANAGLNTDFKQSNDPLFGIGLQYTRKSNYFALDYGYNGRHFIGARYGYNFISK
jgi:hypothetical protein